MNYIIFNSDGSINTFVLGESVQQGDNNTKEIFATVFSKPIANYTCVAEFELPNGDINELNGVADQQEIDGQVYDGYSIILTQAQTLYAGELKVNLKLLDLSDNVLCTYQFVIKVNPTAYEPNETLITEAQFNQIVRSLNSYALKLKTVPFFDFDASNNKTIAQLYETVKQDGTGKHVSVTSIRGITNAATYLLALTKTGNNYYLEAERFSSGSTASRDRWVGADLAGSTTLDSIFNRSNAYYKPYALLSEIPDVSDMVTLSTPQTITGAKTIQTLITWAITNYNGYRVTIPNKDGEIALKEDVVDKTTNGQTITGSKVFQNRVYIGGENGTLYLAYTIDNNSPSTVAVTKGYVDTKLQEYGRGGYKVVDITTYPTLADFLASEGEEGHIYLYPIDTTEAPDFESGYYQYIWEENAWVSLGTTTIDLSNYATLDSNQIITGVKTFSNGIKTNSIKDTTGTYTWTFPADDGVIATREWVGEWYYTKAITNLYLEGKLSYAVDNFPTIPNGQVGVKYDSTENSITFRYRIDQYTTVDATTLYVRRFKFVTGSPRTVELQDKSGTVALVDDTIRFIDYTADMTFSAEQLAIIQDNKAVLIYHYQNDYIALNKKYNSGSYIYYKGSNATSDFEVKITIADRTSVLTQAYGGSYVPLASDSRPNAFTADTSVTPTSSVRALTFNGTLWAGEYKANAILPWLGSDSTARIGNVPELAEHWEMADQFQYGSITNIYTRWLHRVTNGGVNGTVDAIYDIELPAKSGTVALTSDLTKLYKHKIYRADSPSTTPTEYVEIISPRATSLQGANQTEIFNWLKVADWYGFYANATQVYNICGYVFSVPTMWFYYIKDISGTPTISTFLLTVLGSGTLYDVVTEL